MASPANANAGGGGYNHRVSFSSDVVPLEAPLEGELSHETILAEAIFDNWEETTCHALKAIWVSRESGEPGPSFDYDLLRKMLDKFSKRLPETTRGVFGALLYTRTRYFAGYELYFHEQRNRNDLYAERKLLQARRHDIQDHQEMYEHTALDDNDLARTRNDRECKQTLERFRICGDGIVRCARELYAAKLAAVPHIKQLIAEFNQASQRFHAAMRAQPNNGDSTKRSNGKSSAQTKKLNASAPLAGSGIKKRRDRVMGRTGKMGREAIGVAAAKKLETVKA